VKNSECPKAGEREDGRKKAFTVIPSRCMNQLHGRREGARDTPQRVPLGGFGDDDREQDMEESTVHSTVRHIVDHQVK
jgi:hypothetical protein